MPVRRSNPLFSQADVLIAPATPCSATPIGAEEIVINGQPLPVRASMGMLTQPISFPRSAGGDRAPCVPPAVSRLACSWIAAPFNEQACLRRARGRWKRWALPMPEWRRSAA